MNIPIEDLEATREDWESMADGSHCARCGCSTDIHFLSEMPGHSKFILKRGECSKCNCPRWTTLPETKDTFIKVLRPSGGML